MMEDRLVEAVAVGESVAHDMSMFGLFMQADLIVKLVMFMLLIASVWCWAIIFECLDQRVTFTLLDALVKFIKWLA